HRRHLGARCAPLPEAREDVVDPAGRPDVPPFAPGRPRRLRGGEEAMSVAETVTYEAIEVERRGPIAIVWLNRPDQLNAWDWQMSREMTHAYAALDADDAVRAIVLTGRGRAFCAGAGLVPTGATFDGSRKRDEFDDRYRGPL